MRTYIIEDDQRTVDAADGVVADARLDGGHPGVDEVGRHGGVSRTAREGGMEQGKESKGSWKSRGGSSGGVGMAVLRHVMLHLTARALTIAS